MIKKSVPHFFTSLNLISGCLAIYFAFLFQFETAFIFMLTGVFFDVWDGFFARLLKVESELGVQMDSMADMVTCGVAPGIILAQLFVLAGNRSVDVELEWSFINTSFEFIPWVLVGFILTLGAAFRLAKFNLDNSQKYTFIGLPTPAMALFIGSLPILLKQPHFVFLKPLVISNPVLTAFALIFVILMNAKFPLFSFKSNKTGLMDMVLKILLILISIVLFGIFYWGGVCIIILVYLILNLIRNSLVKIGFAEE